MRLLFRCVVVFLFWGMGVNTVAQQIVAKGKVQNRKGELIAGASIHIRNEHIANSDENGEFNLILSPGKYLIQISSVGYKMFREELDIAALPMFFTLEVDTASLQEVTIRQKTAAQMVRETSYAVDIVDINSIRNRNLDVNRLLDAMPGIRVRETGGLGSDVNYSLHGLTGKSVRFFIDGIPMETFGAGFSINNFPAGTLERMEVYKGVTPIELSGDALGGAINLVTRKDIRSYIDASYTVGSFHTHKANLSVRWRQQNGFTIGLSGVWNYSKNNYQVWGNTVEVADAGGRPIAGKKYRRFNDDFNSYAIKTSIGFLNTRWADELMFELAYSNMEKGIQTGRTMAFVYGDVRYKENFLMPFFRYAKKNLLTRGLNVNLYAAMNQLQGQTIDTGSAKYNWAQEIIATTSGELDGIRAQKSLYTFKDNNMMAVFNSSYKISSHQTLAFNYAVFHTRRTGSDDIAKAEWTIPFREPQQITKQITALSYQIKFLNDRLSNIFFVKNFNYRAQANLYDFNGGTTKELIKIHTSSNNWGAGYGASFHWTNKRLLKISAEKTTRVPDGVELLGNGINILNAPYLKPETSDNVNAGVQQQVGNDKNKLTMELSVFYRNTRNLIWLGEGDLFGTARYENINKIRSNGFDIALNYTKKKWLELSGNVTWQNVRNRQKFTSSGATNIVYNDRMKNMPALMANGEVRLNHPMKGTTQLGLYIACKYVEGFYLNWPRLGSAQTKKRIPEQFTQDIGVTYSFSNNRYNITAECRNILDKQVYDNYLLQKPGRFFSMSFRYFLQKI